MTRDGHNPRTQREIDRQRKRRLTEAAWIIYLVVLGGMLGGGLATVAVYSVGGVA